MTVSSLEKKTGNSRSTLWHINIIIIYRGKFYYNIPIPNTKSSVSQPMVRVPPVVHGKLTDGTLKKSQFIKKMKWIIIHIDY